jgi:hypothetical protein
MGQDPGRFFNRGRRSWLPEAGAVEVTEVLVTFLPGLIEALKVFGTELDGEAFDIVRVVAPAGDGGLAERLCGTEHAACQWHGGRISGGAAGVAGVSE